MRHRLPPSMGCLAIALAVTFLVRVPLAGQSQSSKSKTTAAAKTWTAPRTPDGQPDLQGVWSYATLTPLERPAELGAREFFTPKEAAALQAAVEDDSAPAPGDPGTYNALWFDRGKVASNLRSSLIVDPSDGRLPLTAEARKNIAAQDEYRHAHPADSYLDLNVWDRCIIYHGVPPISTGYNNTYQIFQTPGYVAILDENIHDVRIIPLDGRPHLGADIRQWNGDSRGHWEGNTLVVETTNYSDKTELRFPSKNTSAVERFTRVSDDLIDYQFTIDDPTLYTKPWTAVRPMPRLKDYQIYEYACHEGNYALMHILTGARKEEKAAEDASKTKNAAR